MGRGAGTRRQLAGKRALIFVGEGYEDLELQYPRLRLQEAGVEVMVIGLEGQESYKGKHGYPQVSELAVMDVSSADADALVIPGGWMPDRLRRHEKVKRLVTGFAEAGKPIASICHGPSVDISAGVVEGVRYTSSHGIKDDLINAGALWQDSPVVVDVEAKRVSARSPEDLPLFCRGLLALMAGTVRVAGQGEKADV